MCGNTIINGKTKKIDFLTPIEFLLVILTKL